MYNSIQDITELVFINNNLKTIFLNKKKQVKTAEGFTRKLQVNLSSYIYYFNSIFIWSNTFSGNDLQSIMISSEKLYNSSKKI